MYRLNTIPNECPPEPETVFVCESCGEAIVVGDEYVDIDGDKYHLECLEDMAMSALLTKFGARISTAGEEDIYDGFNG